MDVMIMESQTMTVNQAAAVAPAVVRRPSLGLAALYRFALLVVPQVLAIKVLGHAPFVCGFACLLLLSLWLSIDVGPFRASSAPKAPKAPQAPRKESQSALPSARTLFYRTFLLLVVVHSKLHI